MKIIYYIFWSIILMIKLFSREAIFWNIILMIKFNDLKIILFCSLQHFLSSSAVAWATPIIPGSRLPLVVRRLYVGAWTRHELVGLGVLIFSYHRIFWVCFGVREDHNILILYSVYYFNSFIVNCTQLELVMIWVTDGLPVWFLR